jgi:hypothetical protein
MAADVEEQQISKSWGCVHMQAAATSRAGHEISLINVLLMYTLLLHSFMASSGKPLNPRFL